MKSPRSIPFIYKLAAIILLVLVLCFSFFKVFDADDSSLTKTLWTSGVTTIDCWFEAPAAIVVECGEYRSDEIAGRFTLPFVIFRDQSPARKPDPVVYLSGGPGNSTYIDENNIDSWFYWLETAQLKRDLILVDQRGTGLSKPNYRCQAYDDYVRRAMAKIVSREEEYQEALDAVQTCVKEFERRGFSLSHYSSSHSARDMNGLLMALGIKQWNIIGTSYGTRLALEWLRFNERSSTESQINTLPNIRSVILDSIYPVDKGLLTEWPESIDKSFAYFFRACREGKICDKDDVKLEAQFWQATEILKMHPEELSVPLWHGDWPVKTLVDDIRFISMITNSLYDQSSYPNIIQAIKQINSQGVESNLDGSNLGGSNLGGNRSKNALQILAEGMINSELAREFNPLIYLAVDCGEIQRVTKNEYEIERAKFPAWQQYTEFAWDYDFCTVFPVRDDIESFRLPVVSDVPMLVLSGGFDPVTPSIWAEEFAQDKSNVIHWHLPEVGHGVSASNLCIHESLVNFLDNPNDIETPPCLLESLAR